MFKFGGMTTAKFLIKKNYLTVENDRGYYGSSTLTNYK